MACTSEIVCLRERERLLQAASLQKCVLPIREIASLKNPITGTPKHFCDTEIIRFSCCFWLIQNAHFLLQSDPSNIIEEKEYSLIKYSDFV